jgi:hypothetical protein
MVKKLETYRRAVRGRDRLKYYAELSGTRVQCRTPGIVTVVMPTD